MNGQPDRNQSDDGDEADRSVGRDHDAPREAATSQFFVRKVAIVAAFAVGLLFLWEVRHVLVLLLIAAALAAGIAPAVRRLRAIVRVTTRRRMRRGTAVLLVYLPFLLVALAAIVIAGPRLLIESQTLFKELPALIEEKILRPLAPYLDVDDISGWFDPEALAEEMPIFGYIRSAVVAISSIIAIAFLVFYMLIDAERLRNLFLLFFPEEDRAKKKRIITRMGKRMSSWLSGQFILATIIGSATFIGLVALGVPYAFPLALVAAVGETIPVIGPIASAVPALIVALFSSTWQFWAVLALAIVIQQVENYILVPRIMGRKVSLSPLGVFVAFMMGASLFGIVGALMAVPLAAVIQVAFEEWFVVRRERRVSRGRPGSLLKRK